jgi:hypothetical protein
MTDFNPADLDWKSDLLAGWTYVEPTTRWFQGHFRSAHRIARTCPTCTETIVLEVTTKALRGEAKNHGLALRRCKKCRDALKQGKATYALHKAEAAITGQPTQPPDEKTAMANRVMKEELEGLYAENKELRNRLAKYELPAAVEQSLLDLPWEN